MQAAIAVIVFGTVCGLSGYLFAWDKGYWAGHKQGHKHGSEGRHLQGWLDATEFYGLSIDDKVCEHPQEDVDPYYRLLDDICRLPEAKIPPEWE